MASEVDICNLALGYLGDAATVVSITPAEGSPQASHCATFYPLARDALLEMHDWGFATKRVLLAQMACPVSQWAYCYAAPSDLVKAISLVDSASTSDTVASLSGEDAAYSVYTPQPYELEASADGTEVVYTNQANALLRYVARVTDTTKFSPLFIRALAASLASMLAGPVLKGEQGMRAAAQWEAVAFGSDGKSGLFGKAAGADAGQKNTDFRQRQQPGWTR